MRDVSGIDASDEFTTSGRFQPEYGTSGCLYRKCDQRRPDVVNYQLATTLLTTRTRSVALVRLPVQRGHDFTATSTEYPSLASSIRNNSTALSLA